MYGSKSIGYQNLKIQMNQCLDQTLIRVTYQGTTEERGR